jgi:O-acetyl-ADP-ribose deacetylase (regulator of RNase III)
MKFVVGDITQATETYIMHGCNAKGVMNSGVAKSLREKFPLIYTDYKSQRDLWLGQTIRSFTDGKVIFNLITQESYGYDGRVYANLSAIDQSIRRSVEMELWTGENIRNIAIPKIGAGRGGLSWMHQVKPMLLQIENDFDVEFIVYSIPDRYLSEEDNC